MVSLLDALGVANRKVLILTDGAKQNVFLSARNLQRTHVMPYADVSTYHVLWSDVVLVESNALGYDLGSVTASREVPCAVYAAARNVVLSVSAMRVS